jgi:hypothetical protein
MLRIFLGLGLLNMVFCTAVPAYTDPVYNGYDARSYVLGKCAASSILFIGTTHKQPVILSLVADILPDLARVGVTHLALEIATDQQGAVDAFFNDSGEASEIELAGSNVSTAFDLDTRFAGWTLGLSRLIAIAPAEPWILAEGIIIH